MQRSVHLDQVAITTPCTVPWETMPGDERVRHCGQCRQDVFNIAGLTRFEAQRLVADRQGRLCARILRRPDGTVVTADCWSRLRAARRRGIVHLVAVLLVVVVPELLRDAVWAHEPGQIGWPRPRFPAHADNPTAAPTASSRERGDAW